MVYEIWCRVGIDAQKKEEKEKEENSYITWSERKPSTVDLVAATKTPRHVQNNEKNAR